MPRFLPPLYTCINTCVYTCLYVSSCIYMHVPVPTYLSVGEREHIQKGELWLTWISFHVIRPSSFCIWVRGVSERQPGRPSPGSRNCEVMSPRKGKATRAVCPLGPRVRWLLSAAHPGGGLVPSRYSG